MEWNDYWIKFLKDKKLQNIVEEIDQVLSYSSDLSIERICYGIYKKYDSYSKELEKIRSEFVREIEKFSGVHLQTSRVKSLDSMLKKVIEKKHDWMMDEDNKYSCLSDDNFDDIITDLIGIRLILSFRGSWKTLHNEIISKFPLKDKNEYNDGKLIPRKQGEVFIAEKPIAYYAFGDDISVYQNEFIDLKMKDNGYRSVHYIICFKGTYIELQTRTIYDEAWSDCDHNYVYKHDDNKSYSALKRMSRILNEFTNASNDLGDLLEDVYDKSPILDEGEKYIATNNITIDQVNGIADRYKKALDYLYKFIGLLTEKEGGNGGKDDL